MGTHIYGRFHLNNEIHWQGELGSSTAVGVDALVSKVVDWGPRVGGRHEVRILPENYINDIFLVFTHKYSSLFQELEIGAYPVVG